MQFLIMHLTFPYLDDKMKCQCHLVRRVSCGTPALELLSMTRLDQG